MTEFPFTWQLERTDNRHQKNTDCTVSIYKISEEWSLECLWCVRNCKTQPVILEIRRSSKVKEILVSGTLKLMRGSECILHRKFIQLIDAGFATTQIELYYLDVGSSNNTTYSITGILTVPAYLGHKEYVNGIQIKSLLNLSTNFESLLDPTATYFSDVKFNCGTDSFSVHKNILSARSPVFAAMFTSEMKENQNNKVDITDISSDVLKNLLTYIYTGKTCKFSYESASELMFAADKYQLQDLKRLCGNYLKSYMSSQNVVNTLVLGYMHDQDLKVFAMDFICNTFDELEILEKTVEWKTVLQNRPALALDVLSRLIKSKEKMLKRVIIKTN